MRRPPGRAAIGRDFDARHAAAAAVRRRARDRHAVAAANHRVDRRCGNRRRGRDNIGRKCGRDQRARRIGAGLQREGVRSHVGEQVDCCLLHRLIGRMGHGTPAVIVVPAIQAPRPLHGAGAEDQGRRAGDGIGVAIERQVMRRRADADRLAEVEDFFDAGNRRRREVNQPVGTRAVVQVLVPLVAERRRRERATNASHTRVAPEPQIRHRGRDVNRRGTGVHRPDRANQAIFGPAAVGHGRAQAGVAPGPCGDALHRVELRAAERVLVTDQSAIRRAIHGRLEARLPVHLVAAEEREADARVARVLDGRALPGGPVLVMPDREEGLRLQGAGQIGRSTFGVDAAHVLDVVPVGLEEAHHRIFGVEQEALGIVRARVESGGCSSLSWHARRSRKPCPRC